MSGESGGDAAPQVQSFSDGTTSSDAVTSNTDLSTDRQVIETGYVTIVVDKPLDAAGDAVRITEQAGGRVDGRNEYAPTDGNQGSATLTLRIPVSALDDTLDTLKALGAVQEVSLSSSDVTMQTQDLDARITALSASVDRLVALLATATDTDTLISLETAISARQGELDSLESQQGYLADQVAMSTVTLNLVSPDQAVVTEPNNFFSGLTRRLGGFHRLLRRTARCPPSAAALDGARRNRCARHHPAGASFPAPRRRGDGTGNDLHRGITECGGGAQEVVRSHQRRGEVIPAERRLQWLPLRWQRLSRWATAR